MQIDNGTWLQGRQNISEHIIAYFQSLFQSQNHQSFEFIDELFQSCISKRDNEEPCKIPDELEIKKALWSIHNLKAPDLIE